MAKDFFGSLGETLTKTARELSDRAEEVYETQRLKNKISGEERQITKAMADIGKIIYKRYRDGVPLEEEEKAICEQIDDRREQIDKYKEEMNGVKGNRFCPSCGNPLGRNDAFCSKCGVACPSPEPEEAAGDTVDGTAEEIYEAEETSAETDAEETSEKTDVTAGTEETGSKVSLTKEEAAGEAETEKVSETETDVQEEKSE